MEERKRRTTFYRNKKFWVIIVILALILWVLSTLISGRRAQHTNELNSMPAMEQHVTDSNYSEHSTTTGPVA